MLQISNQLCVLDTSGLRRGILEKAHNSTYIMHPGSTKMYHDLKQLYWLEGMNNDIANFVSSCLNCQQVKAEHQRTTGLLQEIKILECKW